MNNAKPILVITNNLQQASFRLRIAQLTPLLRERGFDLNVEVRPRQLLARRAMLRTAQNYHAVILQRKLLDPGDIRLLRANSRRIIYDIDDAVMLQQKKVGWVERWRTQRRFEATVQGVDHCVAGNDYLADFFTARKCPVTILPTVVDPNHYAMKQHLPPLPPGEGRPAPRQLEGGEGRTTNDPISLVWIGSRSTLPYLRQFLPAIQAASTEVLNLRLITIADATITESLIKIEHIPWSEETEADALLKGDIGIAPTPDDPWTRGKCGFKIVQYMATGLPVIASPIGANAKLVTPETGLLPRNGKQWTQAIITLARDAQMRHQMGIAARRLVESELSITRAADVWAQILAI